MKKLSAKWLILEHYRKAIETKIGDVNVTVWKPESMGPLPAHEMFSILKNYSESLVYDLDMGEKTRWICRNPDYGAWDAQIAVRNDPRKGRVDVYICALLCRPFSKQAYDYYGEHSGLPAMDRLILMWDSREHDRKNGYKSDYGIFQNPAYEPKIFEVLNPETDFKENL